MLKVVVGIFLLVVLLFMAFLAFLQVRWEVRKRRKRAIEKAEAIEKTRIAEYERKLFTRLRADGFLHSNDQRRQGCLPTIWITHEEYQGFLRVINERMETGRKQLKDQSERIRLLERQLADHLKAARKES